MTPAMLDRIAKRKMTAQSREDLLFGILNSTIANYSLGAPEEPKQPSDFMLRKPKRAEEKIVTPQDRAEHVRNKLIAMFGSPEQQQLTIGGR